MSKFPDSPAERKKCPVGTGVLDYFPDALIEIARVSWEGNEQHNPGQHLHWAREKSTDESDALIRHYLERGKRDSDGMRHSAKMAWRALAYLQKEIENDQSSAEGSTAGTDERYNCVCGNIYDNLYDLTKCYYFNRPGHAPSCDKP